MRHKTSAALQWPADCSIQPNGLYCGDCRDLLKLIPESSIRLVVTSPPYWNMIDYGFAFQIGQSTYEAYLADLLPVWKEVERVLVPNGKLCVDVPIIPVRKADDDSQHTRVIVNLAADIEATILKTTGLLRYSLYVWQKQTTEKMFGSYPYPPNLYEQNTCEFLNVYVKPGSPEKLPRAIKEASKLTSEEWMDLTRQVWWIMPVDIRRSGSHPAPFPEAIPARFVMMYSFRNVETLGFAGDIVLDPFNGSGTTTRTAARLGRRYIGIEGSLLYHTAAQDSMTRAADRSNLESVRSGPMDKTLWNPMRGSAGIDTGQ